LEALMSDDLIRRLKIGNRDPYGGYYLVTPNQTPPPMAFPSESLTQSHTRQSWDDYFFEIARVVSTRATCPRAQIGTVLVDKNRRIIATGFNGAPPNQPHCDEVGCEMFADHCTTAVHSEINAVDDAVERLGSRREGNPSREEQTPLGQYAPTAYVFGDRPICSHCAREMKRAGVVEVKTRHE
jgi:deoxycytidylate deaminase